MLEGNENKKRRLALWYIMGMLFLVAVLALLWPDIGMGESVTVTQTPGQDVTWRQCNPTLEAMREEEALWDTPIQDSPQDVVWRECNPTTEALRAQESQCDIPKQDSAQDVVWRQCNPTIEAMRADSARWDIPSPTPTPRIRICDCILKQITTPTPLTSPINDIDTN